MLRRVGIRSKLLALIAAPMIVIMALSALIVLQFRDDANAARRQVTVTKSLPYLADLEVALQQERAATSAYLAQPGNPRAQQALKGIRAQTDTAFLDLRAHFGTASLSEVAPDAAITANTIANTGFKTLEAVRKASDAGQLTITGLRTVYGGLLGNVISIPSLLAQTLGDPALARSLRGYQSMLQLVEYGVQQRDLLSSVYLTKKVTREQLEQLAALKAGQEATLTSLLPILRDDLPDQRTVAAGALSAGSLRPFEASMAKAAMTGEVVGSVSAWNTTAGTRLTKMTGAAKAIAAQINTNVSTNADRAARTEYIVAAIAIGALLFVIALTAILARRITTPLRRLTDVARDMSTALPDMVEQMQRPGDRPDLTVEPITVRSRDEVGQLAEAFNAVNEVTVRVAGEQAALRGSIAEMFTNMARRNQVLLDRQLAFLDRLEAREEDPDTLENLFRLDHLATRMRRNSESLLVLAGIDAARKLRQPMPLSDVIRAAIGGIEAYDRVDLSVTDDAMISGRVAMSLSHLFAELLENATHFSNPDTRVWVTASAVTDGLLVVVRDQGLGMTDDELAEANERIKNPPITELAVAQRLGFFVVGRLAQRLGAGVRLSHGPRGGVVAEIQLPTSLFGGATLPVTPDTAAEVDGTPVTPAQGTPTDQVVGTHEQITVVPTDDAELPSRGRGTATVDEPEATLPIPMPSIDDTAAIGLPTRTGERSPAEAPAGPAPAPVVDYTAPVVDYTAPVVDYTAPTADYPVPTADYAGPAPVAAYPPAPVAPGPVPAAPIPAAPAPVDPIGVNSVPVAPVPPAPRMPVSPAAGGPVPAPGAADADPALPTPQPVAARTILPNREKGLLRRRAVAPIEPVPAAPQFPRHGLPQGRPVGAPQHELRPSAPAPVAPLPPAPAPVRMPASPVAAVPAAERVTLPVRGPRHEAPVPAPVEAVVGELSPLAQLSQLASASYTPELVSTPDPVIPARQPQPEQEPIALARRQPTAKPVGVVEEAEQPTARPRAAGDVRSMLSGFRAGVQRGRDGSHTNRPAHGVDNMRRD